jgi:hypothetical protein
MEFHLPFFALRKVLPQDGLPEPRPESPPNTHGKRLRNPRDILLLKPESIKPEDKETYRLYPAQISCVVYGYSEWQWLAYAFADTEHTEHDHEGGYEWPHVDDRVVDSAEATFSEGLTEDPITCAPDASLPIWRPRQYFLKAFEIQAKKVMQEWDPVVHKLVVDTRAYVCSHTLGSNKPSG